MNVGSGCSGALGIQTQDETRLDSEETVCFLWFLGSQKVLLLT